MGDETDSSCVEFAQSRIHGIRRIHPPHSQRTDAATLDEPLPEQFLKGEMYGTRAAVDSPNEIAGVELLAWRTRQQREKATLGGRTFDIWHTANNTSVSDSDTDVSSRLLAVLRHLSAPLRGRSVVLIGNRAPAEDGHDIG